MEIKVNGKGLYELTGDELVQVNKAVKLAYLEVNQKGVERFRIGDKVSFLRNGLTVEGLIDEIGSRSVAVSVGDQQMIVAPKKLTKV